MPDLESELELVTQELMAKRAEHASIGAQVKGLEARQAALRRAVVEADCSPVDNTDLTTMVRNDAIIAVLKRAGRPMRIPEIVDALHEAGRTSERNQDIQFYLSNLKKKERVVWVDRGVYALPGY
jgi:hypothetical protein